MTEQRTILKRLSKIQLKHWLSALMLDCLIIIATITYASFNPSPGVLLVALVIVGSRQSALYSLAHDGIHHRICANRKLNDLLCHYFCCLPLGTTMSATRAGHLLHHQQLKTQQDPEAPLFATFLFKLPASKLRVSVLFILCLCGLGAFYTLYGIRRFTHPDFKVLWRTSVFNLTLLAVLLLSNQIIGAALWFGALISSFAAFSYLRDWTEHTAVDYAHRFDAHWSYRWLVFPHKIWLHYEHHHYPSIPYYHLIELRQLLHNDKLSQPVTCLGEVFAHLSHATSNLYQRTS